jgi:PAS domain S-box-containing protein
MSVEDGKPDPQQPGQDKQAPSAAKPTAVSAAAAATATAVPATSPPGTIIERIFETSLDLILVVDRKGTFLRVSPSATAILGFHPDEMVGHSAQEFLHPDDLENTRAEMRLARHGRAMRNFECRYVHHDGHAVALAWTGLWSEADQQHFFIGRDMTERLKLEGQLRHAQKMEAVGQLTGGLAHDFNNILTTIIGMVEQLADEVGDQPKLARIAASLDEAAERGSQLVRRLLAFSRKHPLETRTLDVNDIVTRVVEMLTRTLGADIAVKTALAEGLWSAAADPSQLEDAIVNLALNARDAMPGGGQLLIETANVHLDGDYAAVNLDVTPGDYVLLNITDSGTGMAPHVVEHVFEPFFTTKESGRGTGLGLSMVYGFIKQSRGHVKIYSEVGHGTSIRLYLPRAVTAIAMVEIEPAASALQPARHETVLVVEDDAAVRTVATNILEGLGYQVLQAEDGDAALAILDASGPIDLLFTDLVLPNGMNGHDLLRQAWERRPGLKALFTSGYSANFVAASGAAEAVPLLGKPYRKQKLAEAVRNVLDASG